MRAFHDSVLFRHLPRKGNQTRLKRVFSHPPCEKRLFQHLDFLVSTSPKLNLYGSGRIQNADGRSALLNKLACMVLISGCAVDLNAAKVQGVIADWNCVPSMVENGREKALRNDRRCSLMKNYNREAYGLITSDKKYFRLEDPGNAKILQMLKDSADKDNLHVVITGDIDGNTLKVKLISLL
jgi:hypothetical protein